MSSGKLKIRKWDPTTIAPDAIILLLGKRGTGKSTLMKDLMYNVRHKLDMAIAMSPTEETTEALGSFMCPTMIYNDFRPDKVEQLMSIQRQQWRRGRGSRVGLIMDDCMYDKSIFRGEQGKQFRSLFMNGRHRRVFFLNAMQYCMDLGPDLRSQVDYVFQLRDNIQSSRKKTWEQFFGFFPTFEQFSKTMSVCTENYECLVYDSKASKSNKIEESIFWYKAEVNLPPFKIGKQVYQTLNDKYYSKEKEEKMEKMSFLEHQKVHEEELKKTTRVVKTDEDQKTVVSKKSSNPWDDFC